MFHVSYHQAPKSWPSIRTASLLILLLVTVFAFTFVSNMFEPTVIYQPPVTASSSSSEGLATIEANHFAFTAPTGYFLPSLPETDATNFDPVTTNFGLIRRSYDSDHTLTTTSRQKSYDAEHNLTDWERFSHHLASLNAESPKGTSYHILYLARHGQGYHNLAESYYGTQAWDCYWSELRGDPDSDIVWLDAHLSKLGQQQARAQSKFWKAQLQEEKMPPPEAWYVSPMDRACKTLEITFEPLADQGLLVENWKPTVKEFLREVNGIHTCDQRSPKSVIVDRYPEFTIEHGFSEEDKLWDPIYRESDEAHTYRASLLLDDILSSLLPLEQQQSSKRHTRSNYISLTAHGGMINALLRAIGHREFKVRVGSAIAVIVKAERQPGKRPQRHFGNGQTKPACIGDPLKAGLPGYKSLKDYVDDVEASVDDEVT